MKHKREVRTQIDTTSSRCRSVFCATIAAMVLLASSLRAQSRDSVSFDATVGPSGGYGGRHAYYDGNRMAGELTLAYRPHPDRDQARIFALSVGGQASLDFGDRCVIDVGGGSGCRPTFPSFAHVALLGGIERQFDGAAFRALAGPAFYGSGGSSGIGAQLSLDAAAGFTHLAFIGAVRGSFVSRFSGERLGTRSIEFGLRIQ